jgi:hypothetical protein
LGGIAFACKTAGALNAIKHTWVGRTRSVYKTFPFALI